MRQRTGCPGCHAKGRDSSNNNLVLFEDSETRGYCHVCVSVQATDGDIVTRKPQQVQNQDSSLELAALSTYPIRALEDRGISVETCQRFGVRVAVDESTGSTITDHFYPYIVEGETVGYKKRHLPKQFSAIGKLKGLFGQSQCKKNARLLIVTEGECDALSAWEMLQAKGKDYNVVSLPNGANEAGTLDASTRKELEFFTSHETVVICLDEDEPGQITARALAELLVSQCKVKIMRLKRKDSNEYLKAGDVEGWWSCLRGATDFRPEKIENGAEITMEELMTPIKAGIHLDFLPGTSKKFNGFRRGEMTILLAPAGAGKSTACRQITYELATKQPDPVFNIFLEEGAKKTRQGLVALHAGVALNRFRADPTCADPHLIQEARETILPKIELVNHRGSLSNDSLMNQINYLVKAKGCAYGVLDHLSMVFSGRDDKDERKAMDKLVTMLGDMVEPLNFHLFVVVHINRKSRERDTGGSAKKYPHWLVLEADDGRGSGIFEQVAWNLIGLEPQKLDPSLTDTRGATRTRVMKNREWSVLGVGDYLEYDMDKGRLNPIANPSSTY